MKDRTSFLRAALGANAVFSLSTAGVMLLDGGPLAGAMGLASPWPLYGIASVVLLPFAAMLLWLVFAKRPSVVLARQAAYGDIGWVLASAAVVAGFHAELTSLGIALIVGVAVCVGAFAAGQLEGVRRLVAV